MKVGTKKDYEELAKAVNEGKVSVRYAEELLRSTEPYSVESKLGYYYNLNIDKKHTDK